MTTSVVDNTVLSNFAHVEKPEFLRSAFDNLVVPQAVIYELVEGERLRRVPTVDWSWLTVAELTTDEQACAAELGQTLGQDEAACIALAQSREWMILTDDRDARRAASEAGVLVSGTLGALMNLVRAKAVTLVEGDELLGKMKQHGYRCPVDSLQELLDDE